MEKKLRKAAGRISVLFGTVSAFYFGMWKMLIKPLAGVYLTYKAGELSFLYIAAAIVKCWLSFTVTGLIWSIGYMIKCMLD